MPRTYTFGSYRVEIPEDRLSRAEIRLFHRLSAAADEGATIQAHDMQCILPYADPRNHCTMSLAEAVRLLHPGAALVD